MKKSKKIPTILGLIALLFSTAAGVFFIQKQQVFRISASEEYRPQNVKLTNISDSTFTITWSTQKETEGFVKWGETSAELSNSAQDDLDSPGYLHFVSVAGLSANKVYFFKINSKGSDYDNSGSPWTAKTGAELPLADEASVISGTLLKATGTAAANSIVFLNTSGGSSLSATTSSNGSFVLPISELRNIDSTNYFNFTDETTFEISATAGPDGVASAQSAYKGARNLPTMVLGQVYDYRNLPPNTDNDQPKAELNSPQNQDENEDENTGFNTGDTNIASKSADTKNMTIESVDDGEIIYTNSPEFFGKGPAGTEINITVNSETEITDKTKVSSAGKWNWAPDKNLEPGDHTITLSWKDAEGVVNTLTRNFVVKAAEQNPAFVSTPSSSPKATASPSATLPPTPVSGIGSTTVLLIGMALGLILLASTTLYLSINEKE